MKATDELTRETRTRRFAGTKLVVSASVLVALCTTVGVIHAGTRVAATAHEVTFTGTATSGTFRGSIAAARASSDGNQYIGCETEWYGPNANNTATFVPTNQGFCWARDRNGESRACYLTTKGGTAAALLANINQDSVIQVNYVTVQGQAYCSYIEIFNYSYYPVKS